MQHTYTSFFFLPPTHDIYCFFSDKIVCVSNLFSLMSYDFNSSYSCIELLIIFKHVIWIRNYFKHSKKFFHVFIQQIFNKYLCPRHCLRQWIFVWRPITDKILVFWSLYSKAWLSSLRMWIKAEKRRGEGAAKGLHRLEVWRRRSQQKHWRGTAFVDGRKPGECGIPKSPWTQLLISHVRCCHIMERMTFGLAEWNPCQSHQSGCSEEWPEGLSGVGLRGNIAVEGDSWTHQTPVETSPQSRRALGQVYEPQILFNQSAVLLDTKIS